MKLPAVIKKKDYRIFVLAVFCVAIPAGIAAEHLLYRFCAESAETILSDYSKIFTECEPLQSELVRYLVKSELKKYLLLILLSFSVLGIIGNLGMLFITVFRYMFLMTAVYRSGAGSGYVLCIGAVLLCFLFFMPVYLYCIRLSYTSYLQCRENNTKLWHCTKYQLQTELKMGIIMLGYIALGAVVQGIVCTGLFEQMFR